MNRYSYEESEKKKKVGKVVRAVARFQLTHQNVFLFILGIVFSYLLLKTQVSSQLALALANFGYLSVVALGFLFSFGSFTIPAATALFIMSKSMNPFSVAIIGAIAATASNFMVYKFVKHGLLEEVKNVLAQDFGVDGTVLEHKINRKIQNSKILKSSIPALSGILVSLPLPTEFLVSAMWAVARFDTRKVLFYSFVFSFLGIFNIAILSHILG